MIKRVVTGVLLTLALSGLLFSCAEKSRPLFSLVQEPRDPALVHGVLDNGFQYLLMQNTTPDDRVSVHLNVFAGSVHETDEQQGLAHYLEHMLFNGSEHFAPGELIAYFQSIGMDFGADANARTSFYSTIYDLSLPKGDRQHLEDAFLVIADYAAGALLLESEVDRERGVILAEKRERDSVSFRTFKRELAFEMPGSLLSRRLPIGKASVIETAGRKELKAFYDLWYRPDNMAIVVVGDMDPELAEKLIRERFSQLAPRSDFQGAAPDISWQAHEGLKSFYHHEPEAGSTRVTIQRLVHEPIEPGSVEMLKSRAVARLGNWMFQNRFSRMVRDGSADFSSASAYSGTYLKNVSISAVQAGCDPDEWESGLVHLENALRQALVYGFSPLEFERVKADYLAALESAVAGSNTRKTGELAQSILSAVNQEGLLLSPEQTRDILAPFLNSLKVDDVNQAFEAAWAPDHRLVLVTGNARIEDAAEDKILAVYKTAGTRAVLPYETLGEKAFPYLSLPEQRFGVAQKVGDARGLGIDQIDFENHIRLNLKPTPFKEGEILFKAVFGRGRAGMPGDLSGFGSLVQAIVQESAFGAMDVDELRNALSGRDVTIGFNVNDTYFSIEGSAAPKEAELVFQLLYTYFNDPGFREEGIRLAQTRYRQQYDALIRTPDGMMAVKGDAFLAGNDPRFGLKEPDLAEQVTLEQVRGWLLPAFRQGPLEVSIVGDFDSQTIFELSKTYLGAMTQRDLPLKVPYSGAPIVFPRGRDLVLNLDTKIDKGVVRVAFPTDDYWDITRTRQLSVLSRVFSERLRKRVRETLGASYSPYVYNTPSVIHEGYGVLQAVVQVLPESADLVYSQIEAIARDLAENGVTQEELTLVKAPILTHLKVLRQSNSYWLGSVMANSFRHPQRLDWAGHLVSGYEGITPEQLSRKAGQYLQIENRARIVIQPR